MNINEPATPSKQNNSSAAIFPAKRLVPVPFVLGVLLFLAPFIDIRCNDVSLQQVSGVGLATGFEIKTRDNSLLGKLDADNDILIRKSGKREGNFYALAAMILGLGGFIISLMKFKGKEIWTVIAGIGAAAALIGLMINIRSQLRLDLSLRNDDTNISLVVQFTPWYYLAVIAFLIGAFLSYRNSVDNKSSTV